MLTPADFINAIFGDGNITFQSSDNNNLHLTQHIYYDAKSKTVRVKCPTCSTPASPETREQLNENAAFNCQKCGTRFYENELLERNTCTYLDLIEGENLKFKRLLDAVNHDLRTDDAQEAFNRCFQNKEVFGRTPQIYEWGALTLFFCSTFRRNHS